MTWGRWFLAGLVAGAAALAVVFWRGADAETVVTDFAAIVESATVRRPHAAIFSIDTVTLAGESRRGIAAAGASRVAWDVVPADRQWVDVAIGLREQAWTSEANAVLFRVGLSYDGHYEDLVARVIDPSRDAGDRGWVPVRIDLSPYGGRAVSLIFNTAPAPGMPSTHVHAALWGEPRIVQR